MLSWQANPKKCHQTFIKNIIKATNNAFWSINKEKKWIDDKY